MMTYERTGRGALEYYPCRYGTSRILFRGPRRRLQGDYLAFLGGTEIYGRFMQNPIPALVERAISKTCVNFGAPNAGVDVYLNEPVILQAADAAALTVVQVMGAQNMSNRFYAVHPRRNDRFLKASDLLQRLFHEVDFTEFNFTRHMLHSLRELSPERFGVLEDELRAAWLARMKQLVAALRGQTVLLWFADHAPAEGERPFGQDPLFVDRAMMEAMRPRVSRIVEVVASPEALQARTEGMVFAEIERPAAEELLGAAAHQEAADALVPVLSELVGRSD